MDVIVFFLDMITILLLSCMILLFLCFCINVIANIIYDFYLCCQCPSINVANNYDLCCPRCFVFDDPVSDTCTICLEVVSETPLKCGHVFHKKCIKQWLKNNDTCPNCRTEV